MPAPVPLKIFEKDFIQERYRAFLLDHFVPGTYWRWTTVSGTIMDVRIIDRDEDDIATGHSIGIWREGQGEINDPDTRYHLRDMSPDVGWELEQITEGDWLCALLER